MKARLVRIGNSQGVRIPKPLIEQCSLTQTVEISVEDSRLVISPIKQPPRQGWDDAFKAMAEEGDDQLLINDAMEHGWDEQEWEW